MHNADPALKAVIEACDRAISQEDYDTLMSYYAEDAALVVKPGMVVRGKRISAKPLSPLPTISSTDWW